MTLQVPRQVGETAPLWDEQHLDVASAGEAVRGAATSGFSSPVVGAAVQFTQAWSEHCATLDTAAETRADGLRQALGDYLASDEATAADQLTLRSLLVERR